MPIAPKAFEPSGQSVLADELFDFLKEQIAIGNLRPGERLVEEQIALATAVSRTPVREALRRLKAVGLADNRGRSFGVTELNTAEQREVGSVLEHLSGWAAGLAALRLEPADLTSLRYLTERGREAMESDDLKSIVEINRQFHDAVNHASGNRTLAEIIANLTLRVERGSDFAQVRRRHQAQEEHERIVLALERGNAEEAAEAVQEHIRHQLAIAHQFESSNGSAAP